MVTPTTAKAPLRLEEVQVRHYSGATPDYEPKDLRKALMKLARGRAFKLFLEFRDQEGNFLSLTLRNLGTPQEPEWTVYGSRLMLNGGPSEIDGIPTFEDVMRSVTGH